MAVTCLKEAGLISGQYLGVNNQNSGSVTINSGSVTMLTSIMMFNVSDDT